MRRNYDNLTSVSFLLALVVTMGLSVLGQNAVANSDNLPSTPFRIGERLTYTVSFEKYADVAFAEMAVVSRGRLGDRDAVELRSKVKTYDILNAAFYSVDESRVVFAAADSGLPLYVTKTLNNPVSPKESVVDYLNTPVANFDLLTLIYKVRSSGGVGTYSFYENERLYTINFVPGPAESVRVGAGQYDTTLTTVDSDFLRESGLTEVKINFTNDTDRVPVLIRFRTQKGRFRVELSSFQLKEPKVADTQPVVTPSVTPKPSPTARLAPTPVPYVENQPLSEELTFDLGETLDYRLTTAGRALGTVRLQARERKQIKGRDTLVLSAEVISAEPGNPLLSMRDSMVALVSPETLTPFQFDIKSNGQLAYLNQSVHFEPGTGAIASATGSVEAPIGTHSILSLIYAIRSFNLKRSGDRNNPVNDTRVSVYWNGKPYVFSLRPSDPEFIEIRGQKLSSQMIAVTSNDPSFDPGLKIWLSNDAKREPLRFTIGAYQADLFAQTAVQQK